MAEPKEVSDLVRDRFVELIGGKFEVGHGASVYANPVLHLAIHYNQGSGDEAILLVEATDLRESDHFRRQSKRGNQRSIGIEDYRILLARLTGSVNVVELLKGLKISPCVTAGGEDRSGT